LTSRGNDAVTKARDLIARTLTDYKSADISSIGVEPPDDGWALAPDALRFFLRFVEQSHPRHVVEFGSGLSTMVIATAISQSNLSTKFSSLDHDPEFTAITRERLAENSLLRSVSLQCAPLVAREFYGKVLPAYHLKTTLLASKRPADVVLIDGPPDSLGGREGVLHQVFDFARAGTVVLLDDSSRPGELAALHSWQEQYADTIQVIQLQGFAKGLAAIIIQDLPTYNRPHTWPRVDPSHITDAGLREVVVELSQLSPRDGRMVVVDNGDPLVLAASGREGWEFLQRDGIFSGNPIDSEEAIKALEELIAQKAQYLVFLKNTLWWLDYYAQFAEYLSRTFETIKQGNDYVIFDLGKR